MEAEEASIKATVVAVITEEAIAEAAASTEADSTVVRERCTRQSAQSASRNARFRSSRLKEGWSIAETASRSIGTQVNSRG